MPDPSLDNQQRMTRFAQLWVSSQTAVAAYVYSAVTDSHEADDVLQTIAVAAVKAFDSYDADRSFTGWMLGIARHSVIDHHRKRGRDHLIFSDQALAVIADAHEKIEPLSDRRRHALSRCMTVLSPRQREAMRLRYEESLGPAIIAKRMDIAPNTISVMLHRVRETLAQCIERRLAEEAAND